MITIIVKTLMKISTLQALQNTQLNTILSPMSLL